MANQKKELLSVYLLLGDDDEKRSTLRKRMLERVGELGDLTMNMDSFDCDQDCSCGEKIISSCLTMPFVSEKRLVCVTNVEKLDKDSMHVLVEYLSDPSPSSILLLEAEKLAKNTRLFKAIQKIDVKAIIDCQSPKKWEMAKFVISQAKAKGLIIRDDAAQVLVDKIGADTVALSSEINKIMNSHTTSDPITVEEVNSLVEWRSEVKPWVLIDALCARNAIKVFEYLPKVTGTTPLGLLVMASNKLRELLAAKVVIREGGDFERKLCEELNIAPSQSWRVKNHSQWARQYSEAELVRALKSALIIEIKMKSGFDQNLAIEMWLLSILDNQPTLISI